MSINKQMDKEDVSGVCVCVCVSIYIFAATWIDLEGIMWNKPDR